MLVPASAIGLVVYSSARYVRWDDAIALAVGAVALAPLGTRAALAMKPRLLLWCRPAQGCCSSQGAEPLLIRLGSTRAGPTRNKQVRE
jgi:hypothetical protein